MIRRLIPFTIILFFLIPIHYFLYLSLSPTPCTIIGLIFSNLASLVCSCLASLIYMMYSFCLPGLSFLKLSFSLTLFLNSFTNIEGTGKGLNFSGFIFRPCFSTSIASFMYDVIFFSSIRSIAVKRHCRNDLVLLSAATNTLYLSLRNTPFYL